MVKNPIVKNILSVVAVAIFGFLMLNVAFMVDFLFQNLIDLIIKPFTPTDINMVWRWFPPIKHFAFVIIIGLISWPIFRSKLGVLYKAIYMTVPLAVVFATIGMFLGKWSMIAYPLGGLFSLGVLCYFYRTKRSWLYYYTVILVSLTMLLVGLLGVEI